MLLFCNPVEIYVSESESESESVKDCLPHKMQRAVLAAEEKGASSWLTALPLADFGFSLSKSDFRDALHLRYGWTPPRLPKACVCGQPFHVDHALSCSHGGYLGLRHNEVRDLLGEVLEDTCVNVCLEPALKPPEGEKLSPSANSTENARVDIQAGGFWGASRQERAYFDVRVFCPHVRSHCHRFAADLSVPGNGEAPAISGKNFERRRRNIYTFGFFCDGRCRSCCKYFSEALGRHDCNEEVDHVRPSLRMVEMPLVVCPFAFKPPLSAWG